MSRTSQHSAGSIEQAALRRQHAVVSSIASVDGRTSLLTPRLTYRLTYRHTHRLTYDILIDLLIDGSANSMKLRSGSDGSGSEVPTELAALAMPDEASFHMLTTSARVISLRRRLSPNFGTPASERTNESCGAIATKKSHSIDRTYGSAEKGQAGCLRWERSFLHCRKGGFRKGGQKRGRRAGLP